MNITVDPTLAARVAALLAEVAEVEQAKPPAEQEIQAALAGLDQLSARVDAGSLWLSNAPVFSTEAFENSILAALLMIEPDKVRQIIAARAKRQAELWRGLRMSAQEKERKLSRLRSDLRQARAQLEVHRRQIEEATGATLPRVNDDPSVWLMVPDALAELAGASPGRR